MKRLIFLCLLLQPLLAASDDFEENVKQLLNQKYVLGSYGMLTKRQVEERLYEARHGDNFGRKVYRLTVKLSTSSGGVCKILNKEKRSDQDYIDACNFLRFLNLMIRSGVYPEAMIQAFTEQEFWAYYSFLKNSYKKPT